MNDEALRREGLIRPLPVDARRVADALALARRDVATARAMLTVNSDWAYTIAYNAMLQAVRALMFSRGYRPVGSHQHVAVVRYAELNLERKWSVQLDRMRRKRHVSVYDTAGTIPETEAANAVARAEEFFGVIEDRVNGGLEA
ncbi:MAG: HEPN domain-containing protein [Methanomicrobiaceae archaeon]|nr:HEPN domain-containing protein [Methanomicrobiaceae archaeon]